MKVRSNKGITLVILAITIIVILILTGIIVSSARSQFSVTNINKLNSDIETLNAKVSDYYLKNGSLPIFSHVESKDRIADINIDRNHDGEADVNIDINGDEVPDKNIENPWPKIIDVSKARTADLNIDTNKDGKADINIDTDGDGIANVNIDSNGDRKPDLNVDIEGDNIADINIDINGDNRPSLNIDINGDNRADINIDTNKDGKANINIDKDGDEEPDINIDINKDGRPDLNIDTNGDGIPDVNVDTNGDGVADINKDNTGDNIADNSLDNGKSRSVNLDTNGDGLPDINIDKDGDGKPDLNIDTDGDNIADKNIDTNGDGIAEENIDTRQVINIDSNGDGIPDINIDTDGNGTPDVNIDTDGDGKPNLNIDIDKMAYASDSEALKIILEKRVDGTIDDKTKQSIANQINLNDTGSYYVINLGLLENLTLNYGRDYSKWNTVHEASSSIYQDIYIINSVTHQIYYAKGIKTIDNEYYFTKTDQTNEVITEIAFDREIFDISVSSESNNTIRKYIVKLSAVDYQISRAEYAWSTYRDVKDKNNVSFQTITGNENGNPVLTVNTADISSNKYLWIKVTDNYGTEHIKIVADSVMVTDVRTTRYPEDTSKRIISADVSVTDITSEYHYNKLEYGWSGEGDLSKKLKVNFIPFTVNNSGNVTIDSKPLDDTVDCYLWIKATDNYGEEHISIKIIK